MLWSLVRPASAEVTGYHLGIISWGLPRTERRTILIVLMYVKKDAIGRTLSMHPLYK